MRNEAWSIRDQSERHRLRSRYRELGIFLPSCFAGSDPSLLLRLLLLLFSSQLHFFQPEHNFASQPSSLRSLPTASLHQLPIPKAAEKPRPTKKPKTQAKINAQVGGSLAATLANAAQPLDPLVNDPLRFLVDNYSWQRQPGGPHGVIWNRQDGLAPDDGGGMRGNATGLAPAGDGDGPDLVATT